MFVFLNTKFLKMKLDVFELKFVVDEEEEVVVAV